jgi:hypothetical protein
MNPTGTGRVGRAGAQGSPSVANPDGRTARLAPARDVDMNNVLQELRSASAHAWEHMNRGTRDSAAACLERLEHAIGAAAALSPTAEVVDAATYAEEQATLLREVVNNQSERGQ